MSKVESNGLLRSLLLLGGANAATVIISILRQKCLALLVGPEGVGLLGLYNNILASGTTLTSIGMGSSGVHMVSKSVDDKTARDTACTVLVFSLLAHGVVASLCVWLLSEELAGLFLDDRGQSAELKLIAFSIFISSFTLSLTAIMQGLRRVGEFALVTVGSSFFGSVIGVLIVLYAGQTGLIWFILSQTISAMLVAIYFSRDRLYSFWSLVSIRNIFEIWKRLAQRGVVFMLSGLVTTGSLLYLRSTILHSFELSSVGLFTASYGLALLGFSFLTNAMSADFYPRLSKLNEKSIETSWLINKQTELSLALGGPICFVILSFPHFLLSALFSAQFALSADMLMFFTIGNFVRLISWPLGIALLSGSTPRAFFYLELIWSFTFISVTVWLIPQEGLVGVAYAHCLACLVHLLAMFVVIRIKIKFQFSIHCWLVMAMNVVLIIYVTADSLGLSKDSLMIGIFSIAISGLISGRTLLSYLESNEMLMKYCPTYILKICKSMRILIK